MTTWTDNPATTSTRIRAVHINELRTAINADRSAVGLTVYPWTDNPATISTRIRAVHFGQLRTAIQELWLRKRLGALPQWSVGTPPMASRHISARDINDLRTWVDTYEASPAPADPQGIVSFLFNPNETTGPTGITSAWAQNVAALTPAGAEPLLIRALIYADTTDDSLPISELQAAMDTWTNAGFTVAGILTNAFTLPSFGGCANATLGYGGNPLQNSYIAYFSDRAQELAAALAPHLLTIFWVWNEPNFTGIIEPGQNCPATTSTLAPEVFGAMLYQTATQLKAGGATTVYAGSLTMLPGTDPTGPYGAQYLAKMYAYLNANGVQGPYPWDALSLNVEGYPNASFLASVITALSQVQIQYNDYAPIIIGEWGTSDANYNASSAQATYQALRSYFSTMYFYIHPSDSSNGYGAVSWVAASGQYVVQTPYLAWYAGLQQLYALP